MKKTLFLGIFASLQFAAIVSAQTTVKLADGNTFAIEGKEVAEDKYKGKCYLNETPDTIHYYAYQKFEGGRFMLTHTRVPTNYLSKAESKLSGANVKFLDKKRLANTFDIVKFSCNKLGSTMLTTDTKNVFFETIYTNLGKEEKRECSVSLYFKDKAEAKAFVERMKALSKK